MGKDKNGNTNHSSEKPKSHFFRNRLLPLPELRTVLVISWHRTNFPKHFLRQNCKLTNCSYSGYSQWISLDTWELFAYNTKLLHFHLKSPDDVIKMGIANYNHECRQIVMRYSNEWEVSFQTNCPRKTGWT